MPVRGKSRMADETVTRCSECAFVSPDESGHCGMCGARLPKVYPEYSSRKSKGADYDKLIVRGSIGKAADYAHKVWTREMWRVIGLGVLVSLFFGLPVGFTLALWSDYGARWVTSVVNFLLLAFVFAATCRVWLDVVRERRVEFGRAIASGVMHYFHSLYVLIWAAIGIGMTSGLVWLWMIPVRWLDAPDSMVSEGLAGFLIFTWFVVLLIIVLLPMYIWVILGTTLAICRAIDGKSSLWTAPLWAIRKIIEYHWDLFKIGFGQFWVQVIGVVACYVGVFATIPLSLITFTAVYEWLRLHGDDPDEY